MEEEGFLLALAANPTDLITHLVYADWLDEQNDPGGLCLRYWVEVSATVLSDDVFPTLRGNLEGWRAALGRADPEWVELVGKARPWMSERVAELTARLHLRYVQGRRLNRQWLGSLHFSGDHWHVPYWPNNPDPLGRRKHKAWTRRSTLVVNAVSGDVSQIPSWRLREFLTMG